MMNLGIHLPSGQPGASAEGILEVAKAADRLGFDAVWMFDHLFTPVELDSKYPYNRDGSYPMSSADPFFDPLGLFGFLAGATERIALATGVLVAPYRHPIVLAKALATIENLAPGRLLLGLGAGWMREEFEALGVAYERRGSRLDEYLQALRSLWSGEPSAFEGEFYSWPEAGFLPAPTSPIPLIVGGHSDRALARAARFGDGWAIATTRGQGSGLEPVARRLEVLDEHLASEERERAGFRLVYQNVLWFSDEPNPKLPFTGPPEAVAAGLKQAQALGVTDVDLVVFGPAPLVVETAERFAAEVRPLLQ